MALAKIAVLGVDLGKNVCSMVGLDASGAVVMRAQDEAGDVDRFGGEAASLRCRNGSLLRRPSSGPHLRRAWPRRATDVARICPTLRCAPKACITRGGRFHPESCRLIW